MKKKAIRFTAILLILIISLAPTTLIAEARASDYLTSYTAYIVSNGSGSITIYFDVVGTSKMDTIGATTIILRESSDGSTWSAVKTFKYADYSSMMGANTSSYSGNVSYSGSSGKYYYATVTFWAGKGGGGDSQQYTTASKKA